MKINLNENEFVYMTYTNSSGDVFKILLDKDLNIVDILPQYASCEKKESSQTEPTVSDVDMARRMIDKIRAMYDKVFEGKKCCKCNSPKTLTIGRDEHILMWLDKNGYFDKVKTLDKEEAIEYTSEMVKKAIDECTIEETEIKVEDFDEAQLKDKYFINA